MQGRVGIYYIVTNSLKFWKPIHISKTEARRSNKILKLTKVIQYSLLVAVLLSGLYHMLKPLLNSKNVFPFNNNVPSDSIILHTGVLLMQYYAICLVVPIVVAYDTIYFAICIHLITQLRLLKYKFGKMASNSMEELRIGIEHHQLLLR